MVTRGLATTDVVARSRTTLHGDDAAARQLRDEPADQRAAEPSCDHASARAHGYHRRGLTIQNASRRGFRGAPRCVGGGWAPRREHDYAAAGQKSLPVAV